MYTVTFVIKAYEKYYIHDEARNWKYWSARRLVRMLGLLTEEQQYD